MPLIHRKTEHGRRALSTRQPELSRAARNLLLLVDGRRSDEQLLDMLGAGDVDHASLAQLRELGLIEVAAQLADAEAAPATDTPVDAARSEPAVPAPGRAARPDAAEADDAPPSPVARPPGDDAPQRVSMLQRLGRGVRARLQARAAAPRELTAGLAVVIQCAALADDELFVWLESHIERVCEHEPQALAHAVQRAAALRAQIDAQDLRSRGDVPLASFGNRLGGVVESLAGHGRHLHGELLSLGMCLSAELGQDLGVQSRSSAVRLGDLLTRAGLPTRLPRAPSARWLAWLPVDRPGPQGMLDLVLLGDVARPLRRRVAPAAVLEALDRAGALSA